MKKYAAVYITTRNHPTGEPIVEYHSFICDSVEEGGTHLEEIGVTEEMLYGMWELDPKSKIALQATEVIEHQPVTRKQWSVAE